MPELPEVETIRRGLERRVRGARIGEVVIRETRLRSPVDEGALRSLEGRTIRDVSRRAKYLLLDVGDGLVWLLHLGMSGRFLLVDRRAPFELHEHVRVAVDGVGALAFRDPRRFGLMRVGRIEDFAELAGLGPEPLDERFDAAALAVRLRATERDVKAALLDQRLVAGVGIIYASEICFRAGVRPTRRGHRLTRVEAARVALETPAVLKQAVELRGTSFSDYFDLDGVPGEFQTLLWVYDRAGQPCLRCETTIRLCVHGGRSSFYCPSCQR
ncbi:MAG: bifunctional DNA-formamidopyrimidine glycosylase/DNA-(apurinic or apyrimidinic site) lyase [Candidatus Binatia bacterium]